VPFGWQALDSLASAIPWTACAHAASREVASAFPEPFLFERNTYD
jgi:hypothetical protein